MQDKLVALTVATLVAVGMGCGPKEDATMEGSPDAATPRNPGSCDASATPSPLRRHPGRRGTARTRARCVEDA